MLCEASGVLIRKLGSHSKEVLKQTVTKYFGHFLSQCEFNSIYMY